MKNKLIKLGVLCAFICGTYASASAQVPSVPAVPSAPATPSVPANVPAKLSTASEGVKTNAASQATKATSAAQGVETRLNKLKTNLNLTDDQTAKVKDLLMDQVTARKSGDKQAISASNQKMKSGMATILTPEQLTKYKQMMMPAKKAAPPAK